VVRYVFDIDDGMQILLDDEGIECRSIENAMQAVREMIPEIVSESLCKADSLDIVLRVRNEKLRACFEAHIFVEIHSVGKVVN
jgi:chorismate mutase